MTVLYYCTRLAASAWNVLRGVTNSVQESSLCSCVHGALRLCTCEGRPVPFGVSMSARERRHRAGARGHGSYSTTAPVGLVGDK
jgi:hypothetical protein